MRTLTITIIACGAVGVLLLTPHRWNRHPTATDPFTGVASTRPAGTLYVRPFGQSDQLWSISESGRPRKLPPGVTGEPSRYVHGGERWFLTTRPVPHATYPDGACRHELFLLTESGREVQLTDSEDLEPSPFTMRWVANDRDRRIAWIARRWGADQTIREAGIYIAELSVDSAGHVLGLVAQPAAPLLRLALVVDRGYPDWMRAAVPDVCSFDVSPDGSAWVWETLAQELHVSTLDANTTRLLTPRRGCDPVFSPDGDSIAFKPMEPFGPIALVGLDGSLVEEHVPTTPGPCVVTRPVFSPDGDHIAHSRMQRSDETPGSDLLVAVWTFDHGHSARADAVLRSSRGFTAIAWRDHLEAELPVVAASPLQKQPAF